MADLFSSNANQFGNKFGGGSNNPPFGNSGQGIPPKQNKNQIITNLYRSVLGRDPDPSALMYYISQPEINEDVVRKQMVESEEHKSILVDFKKIPELKKEIEDLKSGEKLKEKATGDKQLEIDELNKILKHKSLEITKVREEMEVLKKQIHAQPAKLTAPTVQHTSENPGLLRGLLKKFNLVD